VKSVGSRQLADYIRLRSDFRNPMYMMQLANVLGFDAARLDGMRRGEITPTPEEAQVFQDKLSISTIAWSVPQ